ncbi:MAG: carboxypeptidase-like regulatory domain-containing protein, partial [Ktedonobacterales bacterium]
HRAFIPVALVALAAFLAWSMPGAAAHAAVAHRAASTNGVISGTVENGSKGNAPVPGQTVTLDVFVSHAQTQSDGTATTDAHGRFSFTGLDGSGSTIYQVTTHYQNGDFTGAPIGFASTTTETQTLTVYETTFDPAVLSVTNTTMLFSPPETKTGLIPVGVFITFKNSTNRAFVATTAAPAGAMPASLLRFALPPDAQSLALGSGFTNVRVIQVDKGFAALATIPPGTTQFAYVYYLPYTGTDYHFQFQAVYPTAAVTLLVPTTVLVDGGDYAVKPPVQALGQQYQLLEADNVQPGEVLKMRLWNLPLPGEQPDLDQRLLLLLGGALALLLALLLALYLKRGNLAVALGILPASALPKPAESRGGQEREAERKRLLKLLASLENQHTVGNITDADYIRRRDATRRKLKALLAETIISAPPPPAASRTTPPTEIEPAQPEIEPVSQSAQADFVAERHPGAVSTAGPVPASPLPAGRGAGGEVPRAGGEVPRRRRATVGGRR